MTTTSPARHLLATLRELAAEIAYGVNAGTAIRHGQPPPPPPGATRDAAVAAREAARDRAEAAGGSSPLADVRPTR